MASSKPSVIQFNDEPDPQSELQFQDFSLAESSSGVATLSPTGTYNFPDSPDSHVIESDDLLGAEKKEDSSFWKFSYYQSFFNIETVDFIDRLKWSCIPVLGRATFLDRQIRPRPDLYGPFWITFCLVYSTAIMTNVASYFNGTLREKRELTFNFHRVSMSAVIIYAYVFALPIIIWGVLRHFQYSNRYSLLEIICVYGYSLAIFVPISIFWIFDAAWLHWILVIVGIALTGTVLLQVFWPIFRDDNKKTGTILLTTILICHLLLGVGFGTLFFTERVSWVSTSPAGTISTLATTTTALKLDSLKMSRSVEEDKKMIHNIPTGENISTATSQILHNPNGIGINSINKGQSKEPLDNLKQELNKDTVSETVKQNNVALNKI